MNYDNFLDLFVSDDEFRPQLMKPCANGTVVFATNGRVAIKVIKSRCEKEYQRIEKYPNVQKVFDDSLKSHPISKTIALDKLRTLFQSFPRVPKYEACNLCKGTGRCICPNCDMDHDCGHCNDGHTDEIIGDEIDSNEHFVLGAATVLAKTFEPVYLVCDSLNSDLKIAADSAEHGTVIYCADVAMIVMPVTSGSQSCFEKIEFDN